MPGGKCYPINHPDNAQAFIFLLEDFFAYEGGC